MRFISGSSVLLLSLSACTTGDSGTVNVNLAPVADAGQDVSVGAGAAAELDGRTSFDPEGKPLTYTWAFDHLPEGSTLSEAAAPFSRNGSGDAGATSFVPDALGIYVVGLTVSDGVNTSTADYTLVTVASSDALPVAEAGTDLTVDAGARVDLDGSKSYDPNGAALGYTWTVVDVPHNSAVTTASLTGADTVAASFTADQKGVYIVNLQVSNGLTSSQPDTVFVTALGSEIEPVASAGADFAGEDCSFLALDGSKSVDPDGDVLTYFWDIQSKPANSMADSNSFSDRGAASPTFYPDQAGTYVLSLSVTDGVYWSSPDSITVTVAERSFNTAPTLQITTIPTVAAGEAACEEDGYSYACEECADQKVEVMPYLTVKDPDGDPMIYKWEIVSGEGLLSDADTVLEQTFTLTEVASGDPGECEQNDYTYKLTVTDCVGDDTTQSVTITAECCGVKAK